jgi:glutathionylspermidine synthase
MKRNPITPRSGWEKKVEEAGLVFHSPDQTYWNEAAYYSFTSAEVDMLEKTTNDLHAMCLDAVQFVIDHNRFADLKIPELAVPVIKRAWEAEPPAIYGRFDLAYDGKNPPKLLEYNADTPTSLLEAAVVQWYWLQDVFPKADQFNSIHERLIAKWKELKDYLKMPLYLTNMDTTEDTMTVAYMRDTAEQAGLTCKSILIGEIGWDPEQNYFVDMDLNPIRSVFKLYPWEWLLADEFGEHTLMTYGETQWVEPIWKMVLSNKGILAILFNKDKDNQQDPKKIYVNLSGATFLCSAGVRALMQHSRTMKARQGELLVTRPSLEAAEVLKMAGVYDHLVEKI